METTAPGDTTPTFDASLQFSEYYAAPDGKARVPSALVAQLADKLWDSSKMWVSSAGQPERTPALDLKYPGYTAYSFQFHKPISGSMGTVPSRAVVLIRLPADSAASGPTYDAFTLTYPTVRASTPTFMPNGVAVHVVTSGKMKTPPSIAGLKNTLWYQLGETGGPRVYIIKLEKNPACNPDVCLGYASGDLYPYRVTAAFALVKGL